MRNNMYYRFIEKINISLDKSCKEEKPTGREVEIVASLRSLKGTVPHCKFFTEFFLFLDIWCPDMSQVKI